MLVHEWALLRYGVFDETPSEDKGNHFYAADNGQFEATRCSKSLSGEVFLLFTVSHC